MKNIFRATQHFFCRSKLVVRMFFIFTALFNATSLQADMVCTKTEGVGFVDTTDSISEMFRLNCLGEIQTGCTGSFGGVISLSSITGGIAVPSGHAYCLSHCPDGVFGGAPFFDFFVSCDAVGDTYFADLNNLNDDGNNNGSQTASSCNPINLISGNKYKIHTDVPSIIEGSSLHKPEFTRTYNSSVTINEERLSGFSLYNNGWSNSYQRKIEFVSPGRPGVNYVGSINVPEGIRADLQSIKYASEQQACETGANEVLRNTTSPFSPRVISGRPVYRDRVCYLVDEYGRFITTIPIKSSVGLNGFTGGVNISAELNLHRSDGNVLTFSLATTTLTENFYNAKTPGVNTQVVRNIVDMSEDNRGSLFDKTLSYVYTDENDIVETYNRSGVLQTITYPNGIIESLQYDATTGLLNQVVNNIGHSLQFTYNASNQVETVTEDSRVWTYAYNADGLLEKVTNPDLTEKNYQYTTTPQGTLLAGLIDERNIRYSTFDYYDNGLAKSSYLGDSLSKIDNTSVLYNTGANTVTDSRGNQTVLQISTSAVKGLLTQIDSGVCPDCTSKDAAFNYDINTAAPFQSKLNLLDKTEFDILTNYNSYDANGNPTSITEAVNTPEAKLTTYSYDPRFKSKVSSITEPSVFADNVKVTNFTYDAYANITDVTINGFTPDGTPVTRSSTFKYNGPLNQISEYDGPRSDVNDIIFFDYYANTAAEGNNRARLKSVRTFDNVYYQNNITYTATGKIAREERANNLVISYFYYPGNDRLRSMRQTDIISGATQTTRWRYLPTGEVQQITQGAFSVTQTVLTLTYDDARRLTRVTDALGNYIEYVLDSEGNIENENIYDVSGTLTKALTQTFDTYNRLDTQTQVNENQSINFNPDGTIDTLTDGNNIVSKYEYDSLKRLTNITQNQGGINTATANVITQLVYDVQNNLVSLTDGNNANTRYVYDDLGNLLSQASPDTGTTTYQYDLAGNVTSLTTANGAEFNYEYDALNRLISELETGNANSTTYVYDTCQNGVGQLCEINNLSDLLSYKYDAFGNITEHQGIRYTYNTLNRIETITYPSGALVAYAYDALGAVSNMQLTHNGVTQNIVSNVTHAPFGDIESLLFANGKSLNQQFDYAYRITSKEVTGALELSYPVFDANGNIEQIDDALNVSTNNYAYDELNRLSTASGVFGSQVFEYDRVGNRTKLTDASVLDYVYEPNSNRAAQIGTSNIDIDLNGNTLQDRNFYYNYNAKNELTFINTSKFFGTVATYNYNALGQRIKKTLTQPSKVIKYAYGINGELMAETSGINTTEYIYLEGQPIAFVNTANQSNRDIAVVLASDPVLKNNIITVNWQGITTPVNSDWIAVTAVGAPDSDFTNWIYTDGSEAGSVNLLLDNINIVAGSQYEIRLYANDGFTRLATSQPFDINPTNVSLRNVSLSAIRGDTVNIAWNAIATPTASDWLGLYAIGADDGNYSGFAYTGGASSGEQAFALTSANLVAGQMYEMRLFANDGFTKLATSEPFRLLGSSAASITSNVFYIHNDHLGTPKALTDNNGQLVWYATAEPFGQATVNDDVDGDGVAVEFNIRQPGQYFDVESGFYYNYFRYYDPRTGRYVTSDPIGLAGGINTYAYALNSPLRYIDKDGRIVIQVLSGLVGGAYSGYTSYRRTDSFYEASVEFGLGFASGVFKPGLTAGLVGITVELFKQRRQQEASCGADGLSINGVVTAGVLNTSGVSGSIVNNRFNRINSKNPYGFVINEILSNIVGDGLTSILPK